MRFITVAFAYLAAAFVGSYGEVILVHMLAEDLGGYLGPILSSPTLALIGLIFAAPVAIPVIWWTEMRKWSHPAIFGAAGCALGIALALLFFEVPLFSRDMWTSTMATAMAGSLAALTYWLIAWKLYPPQKTDKKRHEV